MNALGDDFLDVCRAFGALERALVCCGGVSVPQCVLLQELLRGDAEVSELARCTGVSTSAMTRLIDGLERRGSVERSRAAGDRRRVSVRLTPEGRREAEELRARTESVVAGLFAKLPRDRRAQVRESLKLLAAALLPSLSCCGSSKLNACAAPGARGAKEDEE